MCFSHVHFYADVHAHPHFNFQTVTVLLSERTLKAISGKFEHDLRILRYILQDIGQSADQCQSSLVQTHKIIITRFGFGKQVYMHKDEHKMG